MKEISTEISISSTPSEIWKVLMSLNNWPKWNPIVNEIQGKTAIGSELAITMSDAKGNDSKKYKAIVTDLKQDERFVFTATMMAKFMFSAERIIEIKPIDQGSILIQREVYNGLMVSLFWGKLSTDASTMLNKMNKALKQEMEK